MSNVKDVGKSRLLSHQRRKYWSWTAPSSWSYSSTGRAPSSKQSVHSFLFCVLLLGIVCTVFQTHALGCQDPDMGSGRGFFWATKKIVQLDKMQIFCLFSSIFFWNLHEGFPSRPLALRREYPALLNMACYHFSLFVHQFCFPDLQSGSTWHQCLYLLKDLLWTIPLTFAGVLDDSSVLLITETVAGNILLPFLLILSNVFFLLIE